MERKISFLLDYLSLWLSIYNKMLPNVRNETSGMAVNSIIKVKKNKGDPDKDWTTKRAGLKKDINREDEKRK